MRIVKKILVGLVGLTLFLYDVVFALRLRVFPFGKKTLIRSDWYKKLSNFWLSEKMLEATELQLKKFPRILHTHERMYEADQLLKRYESDTSFRRELDKKVEDRYQTILKQEMDGLDPWKNVFDAKIKKSPIEAGLGDMITRNKN